MRAALPLVIPTALIGASFGVAAATTGWGTLAPIVMDNDDVAQLSREAPDATIVAVHFETVSHSTQTRADLRARIGEERILVPDDGAEIAL